MIHRKQNKMLGELNDLKVNKTRPLNQSQEIDELIHINKPIAPIGEMLRSIDEIRKISQENKLQTNDSQSVLKPRPQITNERLNESMTMPNRIK